MVLLIILLVAMQLSSAQQSSAQESSVPVVAQGCLTYGASTVVLRGTIRGHTFPGPPNYESVAKGDAPEVAWVLHLSKPICVSASNGLEAESGVSDLQLLLAD